MNRTIGEAWIEKLFTRMASLWGSRFADMWRDTDLDEVKATWRMGLADMPDAALKRGVANLFHAPHPPDLPAFRRMCAPLPPEHRPAAALTDQRRASPEVVAAGVAQIRESAAALVRAAPMSGNGIAWAYRLLERAARGEAVMPQQLQVASSAIESWTCSHGSSRAQHEAPDTHKGEPIREPGCDDEEPQGEAA